MKLLKQVALVSAIAAASGSAFAMEAMTDEALGATTGQDGITLTITPTTGIQIANVHIHDNDGLDSTATFTISPGGVPTPVPLGGSDSAGALSINNLDIQSGPIVVELDTDGGATAGDSSDAFLNAGVTLNGPTTITFDSITVGESGPAAAAYNGAAQRGIAAGTPNEILGGLTVALNGTVGLNVQLGAQPQGAMAYVSSTVTGGLTLTGLEIIDADGGVGAPATAAALSIGSVSLTDDGFTDLTLGARVNIDSVNGIEIAVQPPAYYAYMEDVGFSDGAGGAVTAGTIGDVELVGLNLGATVITIAGK